ncbi:putative metal-binding motif-containing protein [Myxococcota bacterium]|nr:putative metal-binding motif-containing protein [Myxococcota bacterium]
MKNLLALLPMLLFLSCVPEGHDDNTNNINNVNNTNNVTDADNDGFTVAQGDCNDEDEDINPLAVEVPDGVDNNCDGFIDDDYDGDGYGVADDCDDTNQFINPGMVESCGDGIDNNCNDLIDNQEDCVGGDTCADEMKLIYVIDRDTKDLYRFDPATLDFSLVGTLDCGGTNTPGSMGVTRGGLAYVLFSDETLYEVDTDTAACSATSYSDAATGFGAFGMGFSSDSAGSSEETLFVANASTLGALDTDAWTIANRGAMSSQAEVTGTGDGELWAILPLEARMVRLNKTTGEELESHDLTGFPDLGNIDTFAFAHWGGSLWVFIREYGMGSTTDVYEFDELFNFTRVAEDIGFTVVGAGVSTCAPVVVE